MPNYNNKEPFFIKYLGLSLLINFIANLIK